MLVVSLSWCVEQAFREGEFAQAADHYSNALAALDKMQGEQGGSNGHGRATTIAMKQRVSLLSNRAQVRFKAGQARAAVADCIAAIEHDQASLKALYWGAAAARSLEVRQGGKLAMERERVELDGGILSLLNWAMRGHTAFR